MGNGAAELLQSAALYLLGRGDELVMPWPAYPLYPLLASHGRARPLAYDRAAVLDSVGERTRAVVICNPTTPPATTCPPRSSAPCWPRFPDDVYLLLDEALVHFQDAEPVDACLRLVDAFPRLLVVRTFSKAWGLSGLRAWATPWARSRPAGRCGAQPRRERAHPGGGRTCAAHRRGRDRAPPGRRQPRTRPADRRPACAGTDVTDSQANFVWMAAPGCSGDELAQVLRRQGVLVAPAARHADDHVRAAVRWASRHGSG